MSSADLEATRETWERLAREDPLWAVLTDPSRRGGRWDPAEFFATGEREIESVMRYAERLWPDLGREQALDFGCGVGRLTLALARRFDHVVGVDISETMLRLAMAWAGAPANSTPEAAEKQRPAPTAGLPVAGGEKCEFLLNQRDDLALLQDGRFDFVYSSITLQHVPVAAALSYMREFVRVLRPGGLLLFQAPERRRLSPAGRLVDLVPGLRRRRSGGIEMHGIAPATVIETLEAAGARMLDVTPDESGGARWPGWRYAATR